MADNAKVIELSSKLREELDSSSRAGSPTQAPENPLGIGIHLDIDDEVYHSDPCVTPSLNASTAKLLAERSPEHGWFFHPRLGGHHRPPKKEFDTGLLVHKLLLGCGRDVVLIHKDDFKTKEAREARDQARAEGKIPVLARVFDEALYIVGQMRPRLSDLGVTLSALSEVTLIWTEESTEGPVLCRCKLDNVDLRTGRIYDLKSTGKSGHPDQCARSMVDFGTDIQAAANVSGLSTLKPELAGRASFCALYLEMEPPYCVTPCEPDGAMEELGDMRWQRSKAIWARCLRENHWPSYTTGIVRVSPPQWALNRELCA